MYMMHIMCHTLFLSTLHLLTKTQFLLITPESGTVVMSIEQMRKLRHKED